MGGTQGVASLGLPLVGRPRLVLFVAPPTPTLPHEGGRSGSVRRAPERDHRGPDGLAQATLIN